MGDQLKNQSSIWDAIKFFQKNDKNENQEFWKLPELEAYIDSVSNLKISIKVFRKHIPKQYIDDIRMASQGKTWLIIVKNNVLASRLEMMMDNISLRISRDIGYAPRIKIIVETNNWKYKGLALINKSEEKIDTPSKEEADKIINDFIANIDKYK